MLRTLVALALALSYALDLLQAPCLLPAMLQCRAYRRGFLPLELQCHLPLPRVNVPVPKPFLLLLFFLLLLLLLLLLE
jgi:hypothetical protein